MKVRASVKKRCEHCKIIRRKGRVYVWKVEALIAEDKILASAMKHFEIE